MAGTPLPAARAPQPQSPIVSKELPAAGASEPPGQLRVLSELEVLLRKGPDKREEQEVKAQRVGNPGHTQQLWSRGPSSLRDGPRTWLLP